MSISVPVDGEGFLVNRDDWTEQLAGEMAQADDYELRA